VTKLQHVKKKVKSLSKKKSKRDKSFGDRELSNYNTKDNNSLGLDSTKLSLKKKLSLTSEDVASGIPVDLEKKRKRGPKSTMMALLATQNSTASMGKYDQIVSNEPLRRENIRPKKKNLNSSHEEQKLTSEIQGNIELLENLKTHISKKKGNIL